jgi:hypothetical protein
MSDRRHNRLALGPLIEEMIDDCRDEKRSSVVAYVMIENDQQEQSSDRDTQHHDAGGSGSA